MISEITTIHNSDLFLGEQDVKGLNYNDFEIKIHHCEDISELAVVIALPLDDHTAVEAL